MPILKSLGSSCAVKIGGGFLILITFFGLLTNTVYRFVPPVYDGMTPNVAWLRFETVKPGLLKSGVGSGDLAIMPKIVDSRDSTG